jgi:hypothetical protein
VPALEPPVPSPPPLSLEEQLASANAAPRRKEPAIAIRFI